MKKLLFVSILVLLSACDNQPSAQNQQQAVTQIVPVNTNLPPLQIATGEPGNLKEWITVQAKKQNLNVDWRLKGTYNLTEQEKSMYSQINLGQVLNIITGNLSTNNFILFSQWQARTPDKPFPYPLGVFIAQCQNNLVLMELLGPAQFDEELKNGSLKGCSIPKADLGLNMSAPPVLPQEQTQPPNNNQ